MTHKDCGGKIINNEVDGTFRCDECGQKGTDVIKGVVEEDNPDLETAEEYSIV